ncbi:MAG: hypothetical protein AAFU57_06735 [Bacteroidota bacterium]
MDENGTDKLVNHFPSTIRDAYGSNKNLARILDQGIEMLFYLEEDAFDRKQIQNVAAALRDIAVVLRQSD